MDEVKSLEVLGTVARLQNLLSYAQLYFIENSVIFTHLWDKKNGRLLDMQESENLARQLETKSQGKFFSRAIRTTFVFHKDVKASVILTTRKNAGRSAQ